MCFIALKWCDQFCFVHTKKFVGNVTQIVALRYVYSDLQHLPAIFVAMLHRVSGMSTRALRLVAKYYNIAYVLHGGGAAHTQGLSFLVLLHRVINFFGQWKSTVT